MTPAVRRDGSRRDRLAAAYERCPERKRLILALILVERLTLAETADALGLTVSQVERTYRRTLEELDRGARRIRLVTLRARRAPAVERLRKAS